uniref:Uncharacterized protein n=1 Tax=Noctiluca scintillans TaxID=2966 RepID=A0A7S1ABV0_NOCSC
MLDFAKNLAVGAWRGDGTGMSVERSREAMKYMNDGGPEVEQMMAAKRAAADAADADDKIQDHAQQIVKAYRQAAGMLNEVAAEQTHGNHHMKSMAKEFEKRADQYEKVLHKFESELPRPEMTPIEADAVTLLRVQDEAKTRIAKHGAEAANWIAEKVPGLNSVGTPPASVS